MPLRVVGKIIDVNSAEARDMVFSELLELVKRHEAGLATFMDVYYRVISEPLLTPEEKREILKSPTPATILRLRGSSARYEIDGVAIPEPDDRAVLVVAPNNATIAAYYHPRRYPFLAPLVKRPSGVNITNVFKAVSAMVKYRDTIKAVVIVGRLPWGVNRDGLAAIVVTARLARIPVISAKPIVVEEEREAVAATTSRVAAFLAWEEETGDVVTVSAKPEAINRFQAALVEFVNRYGLADDLKAMFGVDVNDYQYWTPWWDYRLGLSDAEDAELRRRLETTGLPSWLARKLARRRYDSINDAVDALREASIYVDGAIIQRIAEVLAERVNVQPEALLQLL